MCVYLYLYSFVRITPVRAAHQFIIFHADRVRASRVRLNGDEHEMCVVICSIIFVLSKQQTEFMHS